MRTVFQLNSSDCKIYKYPVRLKQFHNRMRDFCFRRAELIFLFTYFGSNLLIAGRKSQGPSGYATGNFGVHHLPALRARSLSLRLISGQLYAKQHTVDDPHLYDLLLRLKLTFAR